MADGPQSDDVDPLETREWLDSIDSVLKVHGPDRAHFLLDRLIDYVLVTSRKKDGRGTVSRCEVVLTERDETGVCASDHYGVLADVQIAAS